jgi:hypothetical protein
MGNKISMENERISLTDEFIKHSNPSFFHTLDFIACHYIFTTNFENMTKLYDKTYCDELVILTGDIINKYYSHLEVTHLKERIETGKVIPYKEKIIYMNKNTLNETSSKLSDCYQIAKFYVKISHLFFAILMTINPIFIYEDPITHKIIKATLQEKNNIPHSVTPKIISNSLCGKKINMLFGNEKYQLVHDLNNEEGIPELINLYYDSGFNHNKNTFTKMSEKMKKKYHHDLKEFYKTFTQSNSMPEHIKSFSDIKLNNYSLEEEEEILLEGGKRRENLVIIKEYAKNLKKMIKNVNKIQKQLLDILEKIFIYDKDPEFPENEEIIRISPHLTEKILQNYINTSRQLIVKLYIDCEEDFLEGVKIYEALIENITFHTSLSQLEHLHEELINL